LEHLWCPWRMEYIQSDKNKDICIFCNEMSRPDGIENLIIHRGNRAFIILNRYPYTSGHLMVVPNDHLASLELLDTETRSEIMELTAQSMFVLREVYQPQGFNIGVNIGVAAGAGVLDHVHLHVVPRWGGDTNFMSALSDTRVLPEMLESTFERLQNAWGMKGDRIS
jgi:ATP adenylyltransferase